MNYNDDQLHELELLAHVALARRAVATVEQRAPSASVTPSIEARVITPAPPPRGRIAVVPGVVATPAAPLVDARSLDWPALAQAVAACTACGLCKQRKQAVLGVGALAAPWLLVGEAPGAEEDEHGEPFVGQAGQLLEAMLAAAGLKRGREVYITTVVKCRPPGNRTPSAAEVAACAPYLDRQIDLIAPSLIVALGKTAVARLTGQDGNMASLRGQVYRYRGVAVIATYHPAYLLRTPTEKLKAWEDLVFAKQTLAQTQKP